MFQVPRSKGNTRCPEGQSGSHSQSAQGILKAWYAVETTVDVSGFPSNCLFRPPTVMPGILKLYAQPHSTDSARRFSLLRPSPMAMPFPSIQSTSSGIVRPNCPLKNLQPSQRSTYLSLVLRALVFTTVKGQASRVSSRAFFQHHERPLPVCVRLSVLDRPRCQPQDRSDMCKSLTEFREAIENILEARSSDLYPLCKRENLGEVCPFPFFSGLRPPFIITLLLPHSMKH